jgi:hypothetical protein
VTGIAVPLRLRWSRGGNDDPPAKGGLSSKAEGPASELYHVNDEPAWEKGALRVYRFRGERTGYQRYRAAPGEGVFPAVSSANGANAWTQWFRLCLDKLGLRTQAKDYTPP